MLIRTKSYFWGPIGGALGKGLGEPPLGVRAPLGDPPRVGGPIGVAFGYGWVSLGMDPYP